MVEPCGMYNGFNSDANLCFMNSALQLIFHSVKNFGADLGRCEGAVARAVRGIGEAAYEACKNRKFCLSQVPRLRSNLSQPVHLYGSISLAASEHFSGGRSAIMCCKGSYCVRVRNLIFLHGRG
jgi:hypothetical protein